ncbi:hypothetical protein [Flectobacillus major]|jgi:uncharacterized protein Usg|uniref:hypothetical protein n=1 Tax=Flectobacillus major TaxID=103 RepID=UPI00040AAFFA|nr:hypothetical protein [Flectobacillus major]
MFRVYPTLLNTFSLYLNETKDSQGNLLVDLGEMLDRINRVPKPTTEAQQRGINFEKAITTGENEEAFSEYVVEKTRAFLPPKYKTQVYAETRYKECIIYGYVDIVGGSRAIDLKSTRYYEPNKFLNNHQNLYLLGLQNYGIKTLDYIITDFTEVYQETYSLANYNFSPLYQEIDSFMEFLRQNRKKIRDKKIFVTQTDTTQLNLF